MNRRRGVPLAALLILALGGCSSWIPAQRQVTLPDPPKQQRKVTQTPTQREHQRILAAYGGAYEDKALNAQISKIVARLIAASERPDLRYKVHILNSPAVNAFALPNGQLYVTRGLIALANDTSELASVLSHEMAHVIARHAAIREDQARKAALVSRVVNDVLSDPELGALALAKSKIALASFSRAQEFEADGIGVGISARAGYDPYGAVRFLTSMGRSADLKPSSSKDTRTLDFLSSHPATPERVRNARANARQYTAPGGGVRDKADYLRSINGLIYGEDPSEGFARGRRFVHPKLGFTFTVPPGFSLDNTSQAVLGLKEGGGQALRLDAVKVPAEQTLGEYLKSGWIEKVDPATVEDVKINGFDGATAVAHGEEWSFRLYVLRYGSNVYRFIYAAKNKTPEVDRQFKESVATFRQMNAAEKKAAKPFRIQLVTVGPNDTVERMAARMATPDQRAARFRVLNGLAANQNVTPGDTVKIVVE